MFQLTLIDETLSGKEIQRWEVPVSAPTMTVRELIMLRVSEEIQRREEATLDKYFTGLQEHAEAEKKLNFWGSKKTPPPPDPEAHGYRALDAFQRNAFFILIGNRQAASLDEILELNDATPVSFVRLTPLVGG